MRRYDQIEAFKNTAAGDICHCGRLKRFRDCCGPLSEDGRIGRIATLSLADRSRTTVAAVKYFFGHDPQALRENVTDDRVSEFYSVIADIWPARMSAPSFLSSLKSPSDFSAFYVGWVRPETILRSLTRVGLYTERILVAQPFHLPWNYKDDYDPVMHPAEVRVDTHRWATVMLYLEPWIEDGLVTLIPEPDDFDPTLRDAFNSSGLRRQRDGKIKIDPEDLDRLSEIFKAEHGLNFMSLPDDTIIRNLKATVGLGEAQVPSMLEYIHRFRESNANFIEGALSTTGTGVLQRMSVSTIEGTVYTCGLTGAFPFSDLRGKWNELLEYSEQLPEDAKIWTPLTAAFSRLSFDFLDGYDAKFAYEIRQDGRLIGFRNFLHDMWKKIDGSPSADAAERHARDLADRLTWEHETAKNEWTVIHRKYDSAIKKSAVSTAIGGVVGGFATGMLGVAASLGVHLFQTREDAKNLKGDVANFRTKFPIALFIDIKNRSAM